VSDHERERRQAPQYGEYATPEEVAALRGDAAPVPPPAARPTTPAPAAAPAPASGRPSAVAASGPARFDRILTIGLLVLGALNLVTSTPSYLQFGAAVGDSFEMLGVEGFSSGRAADAAGIWILVISGVILLATIVLSRARLRAGRRAFWIPLLGAVATYVVTFAIMLGVIFGDASLIDSLTSQR
jgi:hypothetical protein